MHFTYEEPDFTKLRQGDILRKTPELSELIAQIHPHYARDDYLFFQVLTQSCDLVRRKGSCKSRYITLAAVRSLDLVVRRIIADFEDKLEFQGKLHCSERHKKTLEDLFNKLLNNNDSHHFYLEASPEHGLTEPCCTQLHLSISIRAYEHFDVCLKSKILELDEGFRAKLGWLVGNLYSRVGTMDYVPGAIPDASSYEQHVKSLMDGYVAWVSQSDFSKFKKLADPKKIPDIETLRNKLDEEREKSRLNRLDSLVTSIVKPLNLDDIQKQSIKNILNQHPMLQKVLGSSI